MRPLVGYRAGQSGSMTHDLFVPVTSHFAPDVRSGRPN